MPTMDDLLKQVDDVQKTLDLEQNDVDTLLAQNQKAIDDLEKMVRDLQDQIANGGGSGATDEQLQEMADKLSALQADIQTTVDTVTQPVDGKKSRHAAPAKKK